MAARKSVDTVLLLEVPLNPESVAGESKTSEIDETNNSGSTSVPVGLRALRATIGGAEVINLEKEKYDGNNNSYPQLFSQVQTIMSWSGLTIYPRQLCQNECQGA